MTAATSDTKEEAKPETSEAEEKLGFFQTLKTFPKRFFLGCGIEMWERLAYYGVRSVIPIYIAQANDPGGLHFTQAQKGSIFAAWALVQSLVPMVSGGFADRYGYKKTIATSVTLACLGYVLMANLRSYPGFFFACLVLALGTALFKPGIQGTLAQSMSKRNSSVGWGLFYWLVNVGAALAPLMGGFLRTKSWPLVFYGSAVVMALNYLMLFTYEEVDSGADKRKGPLRVLVDTFKNILDLRLLAVIALFSGFWMMLYQLWDLMPNFYADWVDSAPFVKSNSWLPTSWIQADPRGPQLKQENALNLNAALVVLFVIPISFLVARLRVMSAITMGVLIATLGTVVYGSSPSVYILFCGIGLFSLGEMLTGPKKTEYFSLIAPPGKKALYLGYVNIPIAIGQALGAKLAGWQYGAYGEKATLALKYLATKTDRHGPGEWDGNVEHLADFVGIKRTAAAEELGKVLGQDANQISDLLWTTYKPYHVWYWFSAVGVVSLIGLVAFSQASKRWKDMNV
ncbi:MAG: MFS transporter [Deltaproteobacteria bacterium]|nr:MFS transporter [Deltaproteobacteria bacterium]